MSVADRLAGHYFIMGIQDIMVRLQKLLIKVATTSGDIDSRALQCFDGAIVLCGRNYFNDELYSEISKCFESLVALCDDFTNASKLCAALDAKVGVLFVDASVFETTYELVDELVRFRSMHRDICVVLVSHSFQKIDFCTSRLPICDISIPSYTTLDSLSELLPIVAINGAYWKSQGLESQ